MSMPKQKPGRSNQSYGTPPEFIRALERRLGIVGFSIDLAATKENSICPQFYSEKDDALVQPWNRGTQWGFCNPPYADIEPWVEKAYHESMWGAQVAMLVPSSTGSSWWWRWVDGIAYITFIKPRLTFVGAKDPYPKDLAILLYASFLEGGSTIWDWKCT